MNQNKKDLLSCLIILGVFVYLYYISSSFPAIPLFFVRLMLIIGFVLLTLLFINIFRRYQHNEGKVDQAENSQIESTNISSVLIIILGLGVYIYILLPLLGYGISTAIASFSIMWLLGARQIFPVLIISILLPSILLVLFKWYLHVDLP